MSVLIKNDSGWFICFKRYLDTIYEKCIDDETKNQSLKFRSEFFRIKTPYVMNSSAVKIAENPRNEKYRKIQNKKAKKNEKLNREKSAQCDTIINTIITKKSTSLIQAARNLNYLEDPDVSSIEWFENNNQAREASKELRNISTEWNMPFDFCNENSHSILKTIGKEEYVLPAHSVFRLCDIRNINSLKGEKYDLIVLDPPWENKSVRRNKKYSTLTCESLIDLPIEELCLPGCLIIVWVTNNMKQMNFIKEKLFPKWNVSNPIIWHWLKITQKGQLIHPIDWHHKKPYENLILGRFSNFESPDTTTFLKLDPHKVIVSVPSSIHSHKPPLVEILKSYVPEHPNCLELFARYLLPEWTSLGNEVLKLQNTKLFERSS